VLGRQPDQHNGTVTATHSEWTILVPVKDTARGKSRIALPADSRKRLAIAMATDTVTAAARCGRVLVIVETESDAAALGVIPGVVAHRTGVTGLNESIQDGVKATSSLGIAQVTDPIAVLPGDLPGLDPDELAEVLALCSVHRFSVVADHQGVGTTLLAATDVTALRAQYGSDSFRRHQRSGAVPIELPPGSTLHWDIDTLGDLDSRVGPFTRAVLG
jgi:2-phospho-L-lactate/phosphoenolpyruvate guanylyltransferase